MNDLTELCKKLEHFVTPRWAVDEILKHELLTPIIVDPCCGTGVLTEAALAAGYKPVTFDIQDWGYQCIVLDFLSKNAGVDAILSGNAVLMNPPFSKAAEFVEKALEKGARKVICFQRFAWWESQKRKEFWDKYPPNRVYICGDRADCWRHDIPVEERGSGSPTAHAWFVWEKGHPAGTIIGHIRKSK